MRHGPLHLFGDTAAAVKLAQAMARPGGRELLMAVVREAHGDTSAAIDPRPELPTVSPFRRRVRLPLKTLGSTKAKPPMTEILERPALRKPPTRGEIALRNAVSQEAAEKLTTMGMEVRVTMDNGNVLIGTLKTLPWKLGHGAWVCGVEGISGGYDCARVKPVEKPSV